MVGTVPVASFETGLFQGRPAAVDTSPAALTTMTRGRSLDFSSSMAQGRKRPCRSLPSAASRVANEEAVASEMKRTRESSKELLETQPSGGSERVRVAAIDLLSLRLPGLPSLALRLNLASGTGRSLARSALGSVASRFRQQSPPIPANDDLPLFSRTQPRSASYVRECACITLLLMRAALKLTLICHPVLAPAPASSLRLPSSLPSLSAHHAS